MQRVRDKRAVLVRVPGEEYGVDGGLTPLGVTEAALSFERAGAEAVNVTD